MDIYYKEHCKEYQSLISIISSTLETIKKNVILSTHTKLKNLLKKNEKIKKNIEKNRIIREQSTEESIQVSKSYRFIDENEKKELLRRLKKEKKLRQQKLKIEKENHDKAFLLELETKRAEESIEKEKKQQEKLKKLQDIHESLVVKKNERIEQHEKSEKELKKVSSVKPLFKELEERFSTIIELPELEKKKQELAKRRQFFAPIDQKTIIVHKKNYEKHLEDLENKRKNKIKEINQSDSITSSLKNIYKSKIFEIVKQNEKEQADLLLQKEYQKKYLAEKSKKYGDIVIELYRPLKKIETSQKSSKVMEKSLSQKRINRIEIKTSQNADLSHKIAVPEPEKHVQTSRTRSIKTSNNRLIRKLPKVAEKKDKSVDYLAEKRKIRESYEKEGSPEKKNIDEILKDSSLSGENKLNKLKNHLKKLETQTRSYEILSEVNSSIAVTSNLNDSYLNSIRVKLAYLEELTKA